MADSASSASFTIVRTWVSGCPSDPVLDVNVAEQRSRLPSDPRILPHHHAVHPLKVPTSANLSRPAKAIRDEVEPSNSVALPVGLN